MASASNTTDNIWHPVADGDWAGPTSSGWPPAELVDEAHAVESLRGPSIRNAPSLPARADQSRD